MVFILQRQLNKDISSIEMGNVRRREIRKQRLQAKREGVPDEEIRGLTTNAAKQIETEEVAWKKLQGDVMRVPKYPMILSFLMGTGVQIFLTVYIYLAMMTIGLINIFLRVAWIFGASMILAGAGYFNGFVTALCMKTAGLTDWIGGATVASFVFPATTLACFIFVDVIEWMERSSEATPLTSMFLYGTIWMCISVGFTYAGATCGYKSKPMTTKNKANPVKRRIPAQPWYMNLALIMVFAGAIQFSCIYVEFMYIWNSVWRSSLYAMFGSLLINMLLLVCVVSEISIVQTYF